MQDHPGAPGSTRQRNPGTDGPAACGGAAGPSPQAWDHVRSRAVPTPMPLPMASGHSRPGATPLPLPSPMAPPGHAGPAGADRSVPPTTALVPAHASRLLQDVLPRVPATPHTLIYPHTHQDAIHATRYTRSSPRPVSAHRADSPSLPGKGPGVRSKSHQVHPALPVPTRPPPATAGTGFPRQHPSRAPPPRPTPPSPAAAGGP